MTINDYIDTFLAPDGSRLYENIKTRFSFHKCLLYFGRSVTLYEILRTFQKRAAKNGFEVSRHRLFSEFNHLLTINKPKDIVVKDLLSFDKDLLVPVKKEMRKNTPDFFEGELRILSPSEGESHFDGTFRDYYKTRFVLLRDYEALIPRTVEEYSKHVKYASEPLISAIGDGEVITFGASFMKYCMDIGTINAKILFGQKLHETTLIERVQYKYGLSEEDADALRYILHLSFQTLAKAV